MAPLEFPKLYPKLEGSLVAQIPLSLSLSLNLPPNFLAGKVDVVVAVVTPAVAATSPPRKLTNGIPVILLISKDNG